MNNQTRKTRGTLARRLGKTAAVLPLVAMSLAACSAPTADSALDGGSAPKAGVQEIRPEVQQLLPEELRGSLSDQLTGRYEGAETLVMATDATVGVPVASFDENNEFVEGFAVDMSQAIGWMLGTDVVITHSVWDGLFPGLEAQRYDFSASVMLDTDARQQKVDFVDYLTDGSSILVAADAELDGLSMPDLCGLSVGVMRGSYEEGLVTDQSESCDGSIDIQIYGGLNEAMLAVQSGRADAMMGAAIQLSYVEAMSAGKLKNAGDVVDPGIDGIALAKGSELVPAVHAALDALREQGIYQDILKLSGVEASALPEITINLKSV